MTYTPVTPAALAAELGLLPTADGLPAWAGLARIIRGAAGRWGACRRLDLKRHALELCEAAALVGADVDERVERVLDLLVELRDLEEASVSAAPPVEVQDEEGDTGEGGAALAVTRAPPAGRYLAPALPRLVGCGQIGLVMGVVEPPQAALVSPRMDEGPASVLRWVRLDVHTEDALVDWEVGHWTLRDWIGPPEHRRCQARWGSRLSPEGAPPAAGPLADLWRLLDDALERLSMPVTDDARLRVLAGRPGELFGRPEAPGRWTTAGQTPDGRWCGALAGYSARHWRPGVVEVRGGEARRWLELFDWDELWWAHLSRAIRSGPREIVRREGDELRLCTALPRQLRRLSALGSRQGWRWRSAAADAVSQALRDHGLEILGPA